MEWRDEGIVIGVRRHGENDVVLELLTRERGRHLGLVRGGRSQKLRPVMQPGNAVDAVWRARLEEHLGEYRVEATAMRAARLIDDPAALYGLSHLAWLVRLLPERDPHPALYETLGIVLDALGDVRLAAPLVVRFEVAVLSELGFGLDLDECAATGARTDLVWVSPKSGRAVSAAAGEPWRDRLLPLPGFLREEGRGALPASEDVGAGFRLTGYFLERHVTDPRGIAPSEARGAFIAAVARHLDASS